MLVEPEALPPELMPACVLLLPAVGWLPTPGFESEEHA
jgi:hypothetical protein